MLTLSRDTGAVLSVVGRPGRYAGQFHWVDDIAIDAKGNLYAGEVDTGKRVQRFVRGEKGRPQAGQRRGMEAARGDPRGNSTHVRALPGG